jgi:hypothetical protein
VVAEMFDVPNETIVIPTDSAGLLRTLNAALDVRATRIQRFQEYYDGRQRLAFATSKFRQAFGSLFGAFADNFCLPTGSPVLTEDGILPIEAVLGRNVLTHDGTNRRAINLTERPVDEDLVRLRTFGSPAARMTGNHPVLATKRGSLAPITAKYSREEHFRLYGLRPNTAYRRDTADRTWIRADELEQGDVLWSAEPWGGDTERFSSDFLALMGWYIAEGSVSDNGRLAFSLHAEERDYHDEIEGLLRRVYGVKHVTRVPSGPNAMQVVTYSKDLCAELVRHGGRGAAGKRLSPEIFDAVDLRPLIRSAYRGDGHRAEIQVSYGTVSLEWASQLQRILARHNVAVAWRTVPARPGHLQSYALTASGSSAGRLAEIVGWQTVDPQFTKAPIAATVDGMVGYAVRDVTREPYAGSVWDLTVEGAHSFVLPGQIAVHNCALIVDAVEERLDVEGFRIGPSVATGRGQVTSGDPDGDKAAWHMWQENELDAFSQIAHTEALVKELSYVLVGPGDNPGVPEITVESALNSIVIYEAGSYRERRAGLKRWIDDDGFLNATLYLPDSIEKYQGKARSQSGPISWSTTGWAPRAVPGEDWPLDNSLGVVPLVPLINRPRLDGTGQSELFTVLPIQDAINKLVMDMIVASEFSAYRQRTATGITIEIDETTGEPTEQFQADVARIWASENENAKFGTLEASDLSPFVSGVEMLIQHLASETRTPYHYFLQHGGQPPSGDSLTASEAGLTFKAKRKQRYWGESWEEVIRLGFLQVGDRARASVAESETIWRDPERKTESELVDALVKLQSMGVPQEQLWSDAGYSPTQIARFLEMRSREPQVPVTTPAAQTVPELATGPMQLTVVRPDGSQTKITRGAAS